MQRRGQRRRVLPEIRRPEAVAEKAAHLAGRSTVVVAVDGDGEVDAGLATSCRVSAPEPRPPEKSTTRRRRGRPGSPRPERVAPGDYVTRLPGRRSGGFNTGVGGVAALRSAVRGSAG